MIKKIIHIADIHIRTFQMHDLYKKQFEILIEELNKKVFEWYDDNIDPSNVRIVIAGDIAHQKINISNEQLMLTSWFLKELTRFGKVIIIPGNHDFLENNTQRLDSISPVVELLNNDWITYYKDSGVYEDENVNWCVYSLLQHNIPPDIPQNGKVNIGLFHGAINGLKTDLGYSFGEDAYDINKFNGTEIVLCGDIHMRQTLYTDSVIEVDESKVKEYLKKGWEKV